MVAAVGSGHLPVAALEVLTGLLPAGGLIAVAVANDLRPEPALRDAAACSTAPCRPRAARDGVHRLTVDGRPLPATALVLERTGNSSGPPGVARP